ncbi:hypothetical protein JEQ12_007662 [Ovis aries]|uniref:Uncharacterized protein n=1 Tax=Ovis aries TaxID=9940 RepID=A0A835ZNF6_SHEEP|nr:hypothetical protein JEQ12_007662 [Ovis aries]
MLSRFLGPHSWELPGMSTVGLAWGTAWQLILDWVLYINSKFKKKI